MSKRKEGEQGLHRLSRRGFLRLTGGVSLEYLVTNAFPELNDLDEHQSAEVAIEDTKLEILNLSAVDVNIHPIAQVYGYVDDVAHQFQQNGWYYPGVRYSYNNQVKQIDI